MTSDQGIHEHIKALVDQEHALRDRLGKGGITAGEEHEQLSALEAQLDQAWDLLRQRKVLRETGGAPDEAAERSPSRGRELPRVAAHRRSRSDRPLSTRARHPRPATS